MRRRIAVVLIAGWLAGWAGLAAWGQGTTREYGYAPPSSNKIGAWLTPLTYYDAGMGQWVRGLRIDNVQWNGPAQRAGLEPGDIIVRVNGVRVESFPEYTAQLDGSGGVASFRIRDVRTGIYNDTPMLQLLAAPQPGNLPPNRIP